MLISDAQRLITEDHEIATAQLLAKYFKCDVFFLAPRNSYKVKTPDIEVAGRLWELKSPTGQSHKNTIRDQLRRGSGQSRNIVIDTSRTQIADDVIERQLHRYIVNRKGSIENLLMIDKRQAIRVIK